MNDPQGNSFRTHLFGSWRFDPNSCELSDGTTATHLEPTIARLLDYFLTHQGRLISRGELIDAVWEDRDVSYDALNRRIAILRQLLSPDDKNAFIETVVRRGFISHFPSPPDMPAAGVKRPLRNNHRILSLLAALAAILVFGAFRIFTENTAPVEDRPRDALPLVAVLPFVTSGLSGDSELFANGMHDDLLTQLAQLHSLRVVSRTSVSEYRDTTRNIREIGRELGADAILEGGVQAVGKEIRINVQLIDARTDVHLWAGQYDREVSAANIFDIQTEISRAIAVALHATLSEQEVIQLKLLPTDNMAAYRAYHRAMEIRKSATIAAPEYIAALEEAVALDPDFVRAWAELAGSLSFANMRAHDADSIRRLDKVLERIQALAPRSPEYVIAQSYYSYYVLKDYKRAYELIKQAQHLRPSDTQLLELKSWIQRRRGDYEGKIESIRLARTLDSRNPYWTVRLVNNLIAVHRYDEALQVIENSPVQNFRLAVLRSLVQMKEHQDPELRLEDLAALQKEFGTTVEPVELWEAQIAARDFAAADALLNSIPAESPPGEGWPLPGLGGTGLARLITLWLLDSRDRLTPLLHEARAKIDEEWNSDTDYFLPHLHLSMAFVTAAEGNAAETGRLVRSWLREAAADLAELANNRHYACRALGMAGATAAAVECIQSGLAEPSLVMPFIEPLLPFYDSMRNDPAFVGLLAKVQSL